jgi:hypothetical protein
LSSSLQPVPDVTQEQIHALEREASAREQELAALKTELLELHTRYMEQIGPLYAELIPLDAAVAEAEIAAGLRVADEDDDEAAGGEPASRFDAAACGPASAPSDGLKRMFRDVVKAVHPDLSRHGDVDERTRWRRHSLMAEANRAYAERDEDRLKLILRAWALDPDLTVESGPDAERVRRQRRASGLSARLVEIEAELADVRRSAIAGLKAKLDEARGQGWDLFAEMKRQVEREIAMGKATLARLRRMPRG